MRRKVHELPHSKLKNFECIVKYNFPVFIYRNYVSIQNQYRRSASIPISLLIKSYYSGKRASEIKIKKRFVSKIYGMIGLRIIL